MELRDRYLDRKIIDGKKKYVPKKWLWIKSSDIFPIYIISFFTYVIILSPIVAFLIEVENLGLSPRIFMVIGALVLAWGIIFWRMVKSIVDAALKQIVSKLRCDETFPFESYQKEQIGCSG